MAVLARIIFFVGFVHDYGEENVHLHDALQVADGDYLAAFDYLRDGSFFERKTDMIELYKFRLLVHVPSGLVMRMFGISDASLALWFVACSVGVVWLTYRLGTIMYERGTGLLAAATVAVFPFDVIWSSRVNSDVILSFFFYTSLLLVIRTVPPHGWRRAGQLLLAGVVAGVAYLAKIVALALTPLLIAFAWRLRGRKAASLLLAGLALVFAAENVFYYDLTGVPFLHLRTAAAGVAKNVLEVFPFKSYEALPGIVLHAYTDAFFFLKLLIGRLGQPLPDSYFFVWGGAAL